MNTQSLDIGKSFTYMFEDPNWIVKLLILGVLTVIGAATSWLLVGLLVLAIVAGYEIDVLRNVEMGVMTPGQVLPEWTDFGEKFATGVKLVIGMVIWALPLIILSLLGNLLALGQNSNDPNAGLGLIQICFGCVSFLYGLLLAVVTPAIYIRFARTRELSSIFDFNGILQFTQANLGNVIIAALLALAAGIIGSIVGAILCGIGLLITLPWATLVQSHLYGQVGRIAGVAPSTIVPPSSPLPPTPPPPPAATL